MDEKLIESIRDFPCLWQVNSRSYKDAIAKDNAWKQVAAQVGKDVTVDDCMKRWKCLRDKFVRELKKTKKKKSGDSGPSYISCWSLFDSLLFLTDSVKHRSTATNFSSSQRTTSESEATPTSPSGDVELDREENDVEENVKSPSIASTSSSSALSTEPEVSKNVRKRKVYDVDKEIVSSLKCIQERWSRRDADSKQIPLDEEGHFGNQVAATLRRLTTKQKAIAKLQIDQVLVNIEFPPDNTFVSPPPSSYAF